MKLKDEIKRAAKDYFFPVVWLKNILIEKLVEFNTWMFKQPIGLRLFAAVLIGMFFGTLFKA